MGFGLRSAMVLSTTITFATLAHGEFNEATALFALVRNHTRACCRVRLLRDRHGEQFAAAVPGNRCALDICGGAA
jgi:hypothetical protein